MKKVLCLFFIFIVHYCLGQKQANIWYFGNDGAGLDFNTGCDPLVLTDGGINGFEGCATIADKSTGQMLFSTNSEWVWNRNQDTIPNSRISVTNANSITQVLIIQKPGSNSLYYIINTDLQAQTTLGYRFHCIDMSMNGGLGGVAFKDSVLYPPVVTEKITAIKHSNGTDIWLVGHEYNSDKFLSFLVTSVGINTTPVISHIGKIYYDGGSSTADAIGELKTSPDGKKIAAVTYYHPNIELFDFNASTGVISNLITLPENGIYNGSGYGCFLYGLAFSSNNKMLYVSQLYLSTLQSGKIIQYNISSNDSATINNSRINIITAASESFYSLKLGPNKKIYVGHQFFGPSSDYIGVINYPDSGGMSCNYVDTGVYLNGKHSGWGLNNLMEYGEYCNATGINETTFEGDKLIYPNPAYNTFTISLHESKVTNAKLKMYDMTGRIVLEETLHSPLSTVNCPLSTGIYLVRVGTGEKVWTQKLVVE